jgi:hypothetical protein
MRLAGLDITDDCTLVLVTRLRRADFAHEADTLWLANYFKERPPIAKNLNMTVNERDFRVSPKSADLLIEELEILPGSAADYLRVVLETSLAAEHGFDVEILDNEERTLVEALRQLQGRRRLPKDLARLLHGRDR